jgi:hypothetical protein
MDSAYSFEPSLNFNQATWRHVSEMSIFRVIVVRASNLPQRTIHIAEDTTVKDFHFANNYWETGFQNFQRMYQWNVSSL